MKKWLMCVGLVGWASVASAQVSAALVGGKNPDGAQALAWVDVGGERGFVEPWAEHYRSNGWVYGMDGVLLAGRGLGATVGGDTDGGSRVGAVWQNSRFHIRALRHFNPGSWQAIVEFNAPVTPRVSFYVWAQPTTLDSEIMFGLSYTIRK